MSHGRGIVQSSAGPAPGDRFAIDANIQVGDVDVSATNPVPIEEVGDTLASTPTISAAAIYADGDCLGGEITFANAARVAGDGGVITDFNIIDDDQEDAEIEIWLFDQTFTSDGDNVAWDPSDADLENCLGVLSTADGTYYDSVAQGVCTVQVTKRYDCVGTSLFAQLVVRGTPTYTATTDVTVKLGCVLD
jgi:hypothetical protein